MRSSRSFTNASIGKSLRLRSVVRESSIAISAAGTIERGNALPDDAAFATATSAYARFDEGEAIVPARRLNRLKPARLVVAVDQWHANLGRSQLPQRLQALPDRA